MKVLVTGANGFIGKNLCLRLKELGHEVLKLGRNDNLPNPEDDIDFIYHLAGVNRPEEDSEFQFQNVNFTNTIAEFWKKCNLRKEVPLIFSSSTWAEYDSPYGNSKKDAEDLLFQLAKNDNLKLGVYRLPGVFGKWCKPNYNSVVATFCYNTSKGLPIEIKSAMDRDCALLYIDDLIENWFNDGNKLQNGGAFMPSGPIYHISLGALASTIQGFAKQRVVSVDKVGNGLTRALYSTYISYLEPEQFDYPLESHVDVRGSFTEILKTSDSGQFSWFTAHPGVTRGGHYHHSKTEKFIVVQGEALFKFKNLGTNETHEIKVSGDKPRVVETIPGWAHDITNIGKTEMLVFLWANEVFDKEKPDTVYYPLTK